MRRVKYYVVIAQYEQNKAKTQDRAAEQQIWEWLLWQVLVSWFWTRVKSESELQFMEIPIAKDRGSETAGGLDFLFQFSPGLSPEVNLNIEAVANSRLPVRGDTLEVRKMSVSLD